MSIVIAKKDLKKSKLHMGNKRVSGDVFLVYDSESNPVRATKFWVSSIPHDSMLQIAEDSISSKYSLSSVLVQEPDKIAEILTPLVTGWAHNDELRRRFNSGITYNFARSYAERFATISNVAISDRSGFESLRRPCVMSFLEGWNEVNVLPFWTEARTREYIRTCINRCQPDSLWFQQP